MLNNTLCRKLIRCFLYLTHNRPDLYYALSVASIYMDQPHEIHWRVLICYSVLGAENIVSQRIQTIMHKIDKMVLQWK